MQQPELLLRFGIALLIGVLIGLEREHARLKEEVAVVNQALLSQPWLPMAAAMATGLAFCAFYFFAQRTREESMVLGVPSTGCNVARNGCMLESNRAK